MSGFRLRFNRLKNIAYPSSLTFDQAFEIEYEYRGESNLIMVKPVMVHSVVIFLVHFPDEGADSMALVYNMKDEWSAIEKESTGETQKIGLAIEKYYSKRYLLTTPSAILN